MAKMSWWQRYHDGKDIMMAKKSWWQRWSDGKDIMMAKISWWKRCSDGKDIMMTKKSWWQRYHDDKDVFFRCGELLREELPVQVSPWLFVHLMWLIWEYQGGGSTVDCLQKSRKDRQFQRFWWEPISTPGERRRSGTQQEHFHDFRGTDQVKILFFDRCL